MIQNEKQQKRKTRSTMLDRLPSGIRSFLIRFLFPFMTLYDVRGNIIKDITMWDRIPSGWRKRFGFKFCVDMHKAVRKSKNLSLKTFRITSLKEKFGRLDMSFNSCSDEVFKVMSKYMRMSFDVCICCGNNADGHTISWIYPMCINCFEGLDEQRKLNLGFQNKGDSKDNDEYDYGHDIKTIHL